MSMSKEDLFKAALNLIQVTPTNSTTLDAAAILYLCDVIAEAEKQYMGTSAYDGLTAEQMKERMAP
jgi:hypothetical protein